MKSSFNIITISLCLLVSLIVALDTEQRPYTLLLFLNSVPLTDGGGHTSFPKLKLKVLPQVGDAILWSNVDIYDDIIADAVHEAVTIFNTETVKYVANLWFNDYPERVKTSSF